MLCLQALPATETFIRHAAHLNFQAPLGLHTRGLGHGICTTRKGRAALCTMPDADSLPPHLLIMAERAGVRTLLLRLNPPYLLLDRPAIPHAETLDRLFVLFCHTRRPNICVSGAVMRLPRARIENDL